MAAQLSSTHPQQHSIANQIPPQHGSIHAGPQISGKPTNLFPDEGKVRELALHIHSSLVQAQQLKLAANSQQQQQPATNQQVSLPTVHVGKYSDICFPHHEDSTS